MSNTMRVKIKEARQAGHEGDAARYSAQREGIDEAMDALDNYLDRQQERLDSIPMGDAAAEELRRREISATVCPGPEERTP